MRGIPSFPTTLTLREQGLFVLGFYHERADRIAAAQSRKAARAADADADADAEEPVAD